MLGSGTSPRGHVAKCCDCRISQDSVAEVVRSQRKIVGVVAANVTFSEDYELWSRISTRYRGNGRKRAIPSFPGLAHHVRMH